MKIFVKNNIFIPVIYNYVFFKLKKSKNNLLIFFNKKKKIKFSLVNNNHFWFDSQTNTIALFSLNKINRFNLGLKKINKNLFLFEHIFFHKIKFKGKGFRVRFKKKYKLIKFTFGHSHINIMFMNKIQIKRLNKYKYIYKSKNTNILNLVSKKIKKIKPMNMYTKRGIRNGKQIIYKRKGKKSTYI